MRIPLLLVKGLLLHLALQHLCLSLHFLCCTRFPLLIVNGGESWAVLGSVRLAGLTSLRLALCLAHISLVSVQHVVDGIDRVEIRGLARNDMRMDVWHALASVDAVLHRDVEARRAVKTLHHAADAPDGQEQVAGFGWGEVCDAGDDSAGRDEDMAGEDGFQVHERKGERRLVEDLC
jgi:hypothetical protein